MASTRGWFKRNRGTLAVGAGLVGSAYFAGQWALSKITEARQRMSDDRIAKENLRRRFAQNQEDCTYTVLALLPTAGENIGRALPVEEILGELQARKTEKMSRSTQVSTAGSEIAPSDVGTEEGSQGTGSFVHASQAIGAGGENGERRPRVLGKSKILLWDELKISSITRALTLLYILPLLTLLTRIQLNLLGRRTYLSSVVSLASPTGTTTTTQPSNNTSNPSSTPPADASSPTISLENHDDDRSDYYGNDFDTNRKYLTFSWWLLHRGWVSIRETVEESVREVFGSWNPRDNMTFEQLASLILAVRKRIEGATEEERSVHRWLLYLLPSEEEEENVLRENGMLGYTPSATNANQQQAITPSLRRLLDETSDLIDSPTFTHVLTLMLDAAFSHLIDSKVATEAFKLPSQARLGPGGIPSQAGAQSTSSFHGPDARVIDVTDEPSATPSAKLATILATFTKQAPGIWKGGDEAIAAVGSAANAQGPGSLMAGGGLGEANEYLAAVEGVRDLEAFAAVVYSSNFEFEGVGSGEAAGAGAGPSTGGLGGGHGVAGSGELGESKDIGGKEVEQSLVEVGRDVQGRLERAWDQARGR